MKLDLLTRAELAKELKICTATLDLWRNKYIEQFDRLFPGEIRFGGGTRSVRFNREDVYRYLFESDMQTWYAENYEKKVK
tara:strand:- start:50 stop:289 length:240 start_codon:yes stop_codon:yes gene_type:complete